MRPVLVHSRGGTPPESVQDLSAEDGRTVGRDALAAAGQALTWRSTHTAGSCTAIPLTGATAVVVQLDNPAWELWHDRFTRGFSHRMAGELTIATVLAGLLGEDALSEDAKMLDSAIDGLGRLLADLEEMESSEATADQIVADAKGTHRALLANVADQRVSVRRAAEFIVYSVRSVTGRPDRAELEQARSRVGLPWPTVPDAGVGTELGLARWRTAMQASGHQLWCRLEDDALVTDLWFRTSPPGREPGTRTRSG